jgi:hypothetical protein
MERNDRNLSRLFALTLWGCEDGGPFAVWRPFHPPRTALTTRTRHDRSVEGRNDERETGRSARRRRRFRQKD